MQRLIEIHVDYEKELDGTLQLQHSRKCKWEPNSVLEILRIIREYYDKKISKTLSHGKHGEYKEDFCLAAENKNTFVYSLSFRGSILWNTLSDSIKSAQNTKGFKTVIRNLTGESCSCIICK